MRRPRVTTDVRCPLLQMVGVSDDVSEYAMALRNTEDKLRRCPKRVRPAGAGASLGAGAEGQLAP